MCNTSSTFGAYETSTVINLFYSVFNLNNCGHATRRRHSDHVGDMVVLELETIYAQVAPHTKLLNKRFVGAHHWLGPLKEALVARLTADKVH